MQDENLIIIKNSYIKFYGGTSPPGSPLDPRLWHLFNPVARGIAYNNWRDKLRPV